MRRFKELLILMEPGCDSRVSRRRRHATVEGTPGSSCKISIFVHGKVTAMLFTSLSVGELGDMQVAKFIAIFQNAQISLFANNVPMLAVPVTLARMLLDHIISFNAPVCIRVILRIVEHGMSVRDEGLLGLLVARLIGVPGAIGVHS